MPNIIITNAKNSDCKGLSYIKHEVWLTTYKGIYSDDKLNNYDYKEHEKKFLKNIDGLYVIKDDDKIIGYFSFSYPRHNYKNYNHSLNSLYILKEYQARGIGRRVFEFINKYCRENNIDSYFTNCNKYNENALKFYLKMGGVITNLEDDALDRERHQYYIEFKRGD